jgi:hypothetical protein
LFVELLLTKSVAEAPESKCRRKASNSYSIERDPDNAYFADAIWRDIFGSPGGYYLSIT